MASLSRLRTTPRRSTPIQMCREGVESRSFPRRSHLGTISYLIFIRKWRIRGVVRAFWVPTGVRRAQYKWTGAEIYAIFVESKKL